jgi:hypothetical protein
MRKPEPGLSVLGPLLTCEGHHAMSNESTVTRRPTTTTITELRNALRDVERLVTELESNRIERERARES